MNMVAAGFEKDDPDDILKRCYGFKIDNIWMAKAWKTVLTDLNLQDHAGKCSYKVRAMFAQL